MLVEQALLEFARRLTEHFGPRVVGLTLFGSYARREARADSDIDLAVVLDRIDHAVERTWPMELAGDLTVEYGLVICPIVMSSAELEFLRAREDVLAANLEREGIAL